MSVVLPARVAELARADREARVGLLVALVREARLGAHELRNALMSSTTHLSALEEELVERGLHDLVLDVSAIRSALTRAVELTRPPSFEAEERIAVAILPEIQRALLEVGEVGVEAEGNAQLCSKVPGGAEGLRRVTRELARNAREGDGTSGAESIAITLRDDTSRGVVRVRITFTDDGPPLPHELVVRGPRVPFTTKGGATGLGLVWARRFAAECGGWLELRRDDGRNVVAIVLPVC